MGAISFLYVHINAFDCFYIAGKEENPVICDITLQGKALKSEATLPRS